MVKRHEVIVTVHIVLHFLALIAEIIVLIMYFVAPYLFHRHLQELMMGLILDYVAEDSQDLASDVMENFMRGLHCCGYHNGTDFDYSVHFDRRRSLNGTIIYLRYPIPCCKHNDRQQRAPGCPQSFNVDNSNIHQGCWPVFDSIFHKYVAIIGCGWIGVVILQILLLIAAVFYVRTKLRRTWPFGLKLGQSTFEEESDNEELADEDFVE
ncbi:hypothetical protein FBUS_02420 [Fasciolopsis buskii]|uniref:Tetraspanin n=1 Tax=Fasciolopsis buskii TaxID=27845 RepID=A0A8E0RWP1_9TREM|nr:hypothetical protein FBUS_02420 [Fasciolopsis buski]